jgi:ATP-binding cassette subfamily F protein uup
VLELDGVDKAFGDLLLIRDLSTRLQAGERVGVIGPNGAGKTTLVRMILGQGRPTAVNQAGHTRIAYFDQRRQQFEPELSVYDAVGGKDWVEVGGRRLHLRSYLEDFLFPIAQQRQVVASLSGGERNRLLLARLFLQPANLLILDEPTNDLDLVTLQVLEAALVEHRGCVLMVTHGASSRQNRDRAGVRGRGMVRRHEGNFELYRRLKERRDGAAGRRGGTAGGRQASRAARRREPGTGEPPRS